MATARDESNPYVGGLGAGGKFRKRPFRRATQTTPYDRPPTALRTPSGTGVRNGWLSKLVDPAQKLITSSAHWLFASVFTKRLHAPPQVLESETNQEARENTTAATSTDPPVVQGAITRGESSSNHTGEGGVAELEEILKQKTFTRSEIDHLTSLLQSRTVDIPGGNEERMSKEKSVVLNDRKEFFSKTPVRENGTERHFVTTPVVSSAVLDKDAASPTELAKAYMDNRPSKSSVAMIGLCNQVPRGDSALPSSRTFPSNSPIMSLVPRSSGHVVSPGNGFVTPRLRGRSAIYSMARTPYSRVNSAAALKGVGSTSDASGGPSSSSSQSAWDQNRISGSRQGVLKRRSSVLDNDIGSIGPIRRIRQKSNLLPSKNLSLPASSRPLSIHVAGTSSAGLDAVAENGNESTPATSFTSVPSKSSEMASKILQQLAKFSPEEKSPAKLSPSMLRGKALKSLENVDSSKFLENMHDCDKLNGSHSTMPDIQYSKPHERVKFKENGPTKLITLPDKSVPVRNGADTDNSMKDNNESVKAADFTEIKSVVQLPQEKKRAFHMSAHEDYLDLDDDDFCNGAPSATFGEGSKGAGAEAILVEKSSCPSEQPISSSSINQKPDLKTSDESAVVENNAGISFTVTQVAASSVPSALLVSHSTSTANKYDAYKEPKASTPMLSFEGKVSPSKQSDAAAPTFGFASTNVGGVSSASGSSDVKLASTSSDLKLENSSSFATTVPSMTNYLPDKTEKQNTSNGIFFRTPETATSSAVSTSTSAGSIFSFGASKNSSTSNNGSLVSSPFSFSSSTQSLIPNKGQSLSSISANSDTVAAPTTSPTAIVTTSSTSSLSMEASVPSFTSAPLFKFASSGGPSTSGSTASATSVEVTESKTQGTSSGNVATVPFGSTAAFTSSGSNIFGDKSGVTGSTMSSASGCTTDVTSSGISGFSGIPSTIPNSGSGFFSSTFSTATNTGNGIFGSATSGTGSSVGGTSATTGTGSSAGGTSATTGTGSSVFGGTSLSIASTGSSIFSTTSAITSSGSNIFGFTASAAPSSATQNLGVNPFSAVNTQASAAGTGIGSSTQSMPIQFSSSASAPSFGLAGNTTFSSGNSVFGSSAPVAKPFSSGPTFGMNSSSSETSSVSSSSGIASSTFGSNWQAPKAPIFGSSSSGFSFGSSASMTAPSSAPTIFGSSTGASSSSMFSFNSAAAATPSQPVFGSPGMVFGSTPSGNNDQMEDSMAEDSVQASPQTVTTFTQPISAPTSGFVFGASNSSGASSFQFGNQPSIATPQNPSPFQTPQNPSPFQASGSLEFGAGGSFSLGTGGADKSGRKFVKVRKQRKK